MGALPVGDGFTAAGSRPSRYASTWYFGDGAALLNQIAAGFIVIPVVARVTPLDPVLTRASIERRRGRSLGVRLSRRGTPRLRVEFSADSLAGTVNLTDAALNGIEATRPSFGPMWDGLIATGAGGLFPKRSRASSNH